MKKFKVTMLETKVKPMTWKDHRNKILKSFQESEKRLRDRTIQNQENKQHMLKLIPQAMMIKEDHN